MTRLCLLLLMLALPVAALMGGWLALHQPARPALLAYMVEMTDERFIVYLLRPQTGQFREVSEGDWAQWTADGQLCVRPALLPTAPFILYDPVSDARQRVEQCEQPPPRGADQRMGVLLPLGGGVGRWQTPPPVLVDLWTGIRLRAPVPRFTFAVRQVSWSPQ